MLPTMAPTNSKPAIRDTFAQYLEKRLADSRIADYQGYVAWILTDGVSFSGAKRFSSVVR